MKVVCIINKYRPFKYDLTIGRYYDVIDFDNLGYKLEDDKGNVKMYPSYCFKTIEEIREDKLIKLGI